MKTAQIWQNLTDALQFNGIMNNRQINASYTNTENHNLHEGLLLSAVSVISKGDKVLIITTTKNTHTVPQVEQ